MNIFMAFPKNMLGDAEITQEVRSLFEIANVPATFTHSKDDFRERFHAAGSWGGWTTDVAMGVEYATRLPRYDIIMCVPMPDTICSVGKATADIAKKALQARKKVYCYMDTRIQPVMDVVASDEDNWQTGWRLVIGSIGEVS